MKSARQCGSDSSCSPIVRPIAVMHPQIVEADRQLTGRYVANWPHCWTMWIGLNRKAEVRAELTKRLDVKRPDIRARETLLKYRSRIFWIDGRRTRAAAKAPQRKRPCRSRATARRSLLPPSFGNAKRRMPLEHGCGLLVATGKRS